MVLVCFVIDLRSLPPQLLRDVKQVKVKQSNRNRPLSRLLRLLFVFALSNFKCSFLKANLIDWWILNFVRQNKNCQSLLELANFYAISSESESLRDKIGLCYVFRNRISSSDEVLYYTLLISSLLYTSNFLACLKLEMHCTAQFVLFRKQLKIAYSPSPRGNFDLRDFHHAVNHLPTDSFLPEIDDPGG